MSYAASPTVRLLHGADMPRLGLGTFPLDDRESERVVAEAIGAGYRLIDTAERYGNEVGVGRGLKASGVAREELFVTTKFNKEWHGRDQVTKACAAALDRLGLEYLDLLMIHWPNPDLDLYVETYEGLVELHKAGVLKAIGMSNFKPAHIARLINETGVIPDVNQIQLSPLMTRAEARAFHREHGIVTQSWSPLGGQGVPVLELPVVREIADAVGRTPAQVVLRWNIELGLNTIAKSADLTRLRQNIDIFDFELTPEQVAAISAVDRGESAAVDSDAFGH